MRCLDVGTWDGFWAFEMERRGARGRRARPRRRARARLAAAPASGRVPEEPRGAGFRLAQRAARLDGRARRAAASTTPTPERARLVRPRVLRSVLIHLRDQLLALERIASGCAPAPFIAPRSTTGSSPVPVARSRATRPSATRRSCSGCRAADVATDAVERRLRPRRAARARFVLAPVNSPHVVLPRAQ